MTVYSIPALGFDNEFISLDYVAKYVDSLMSSSKKSGFMGYSLVYEWDERGPGDRPPQGALRRLPGEGWERLVVLGQCIPNGDNTYFQTFVISKKGVPYTPVNGH